MSSSKRHFTAVIGNKEQGTYVSSSPSSAAKKAVSKLCAEDKKRKVQFSIREITQGSDKKIYGPYIGYMQKLDNPIELEGRIIKYKPVAKLDKKDKKVSSKKTKKQAAGVDVRALISDHSSVISNYVGGGESFKQVKHELEPFVHKIKIFIMNWAKLYGFDVMEKDAVAFAKEYASRIPHKMRKFSGDDVERARAVFFDTYKPPQKAEQRLPLFVHKIMIHIMNWAKQHGFDVREEDAVAFAQEYASNKPHKMLNFKERDLEQARVAFETIYQPPQQAESHVQAQQAQQAQQHRGHQYSHNPYNLFGKLRKAGRDLRIDENILEHYLNWYIEQPGISKNAENPTPEDIKLGYDKMVREISHGAFMFRAVCDKGLSSTTIGHQGFSKLMENNPPSDYIWAFHECPPLQEVQKRMCFKKYRDLENISCFIAGMVFNPDGSIGFFKQSMRKNTVDPKHQIGLPVVLWPCKVGHYVYIPITSHEDNLPRGTNSLYNKSGNYKGIHSKSSKGFNEHENRISANIVPKVADNIRPGEMVQILSNPRYYRACHEAMDIIGGIPVSLDIRPEHQEASEASFLQNQLNKNNSLNSLQQNPWGAAGQ